jgi:3-phytase
VRAQKVREFGRFSGTKEIEAVAVDDELGYVYYADEGDGIHKYHADPDHPEAARELAHFGREGFQGDREGIAIYGLAGGRGYIVARTSFRATRSITFTGARERPGARTITASCSRSFMAGRTRRTASRSLRRGWGRVFPTG